MSSHQITKFESDFWNCSLSTSEFGIVISEVEGRHQAGRGWNTAGVAPHLVLVLLQVLVLSPSASLVLLPVLFLYDTSPRASASSSMTLHVAC